MGWAAGMGRWDAVLSDAVLSDAVLSDAVPSDDPDCWGGVLLVGWSG